MVRNNALALHGVAKVKRSGPLKRTRLENKSPHKRTAEQGGDEMYLRWVRRQPCCVCGKFAPSDAHHRTGAGMGIKAHDHETMPLCRTHHRQLHDLRGHFNDWERSTLREWQRIQALAHRRLFLAEQFQNAGRATE